MHKKSTLCLPLMICILILYFPIVAAHEDDYLEFFSNDKSVGRMFIENIPGGLLLTPEFSTKIQPGMHSIRVHFGLDCDNPGPVLDLHNTRKFYGPYFANGAQGILPNLYVDYSGVARLPIFMPNVDVDTIIGHTIIIYDEPSFFYGPVDIALKLEEGQDLNVPIPKLKLYCAKYG